MRLPFIGSVSPLVVAVAVVGVAGVGAAVVLRSQRETVPLEDLTVEVAQRELTLKITAGGRVVPVKTVNLSPKNSGLLAALLVEQGAVVQAGQVVAVMDSREIEAQIFRAQGALQEAQARLAELQNGTRSEEVSRAQAQVAQSQAQVQEAQSRLQRAQQRLHRYQTLREEGAIAQDDLDAVITEVNQAQAVLNQTQANLKANQDQLAQLKNGPRPETIAQAQAQVKSAQGQLVSLQIQREDTLIRAPFAGIITQRYADPGAFVTPTTSASATASATSTSIVALAQGLEILANVPEVDMGQLSPGQLVEIVADSFPSETFVGKVRLIAPEAIREDNVTSFQVRVALVNGQDRLRSGMNVDLSFVGDRLATALAVPTVAIVTQGGDAGVLVPNDRDQPVFRPVTVGTTVDDQTQILEGVVEGDRVFIELPPDLSFENIKPESSPPPDSSTDQ